MRNAVTLASLLLVPSILSSPCGACAAGSPRIVNGVLTDQYASVGNLMIGGDPATASSGCSGTMIGCQTFLTAAHCVRFATPAQRMVFLPHAGMFTVSSMTALGEFGHIQDLAVVKLSTPVDGVTPSRINTQEDPPKGTLGTLVGYGLGGDTKIDLGLRRTGNLLVGECPVEEFTQTFGSLCWHFRSPAGSPGSNSGICRGDSGGPMFVDLGGGPVIAGVNSAILPTCANPGFGIDAPVFPSRSWIESEAGPDIDSTRCGDLPPFGDPRTSVRTFAGKLTARTTQASHSFEVPYGVAVLRVAMFGAAAENDNENNFDYYVRQGAPATTTTFDCAQDGSAQLGFCQFDEPPQATWHLLVHAAAGEGDYQLIVTMFGPDCARPGTDGKACDDHDPCTQSETCQAGACSGPTLDDGIACDDANSCTTLDACQAGACVGTTAADGSVCQDDDLCSFPDMCLSGVCSGSVPAVGCAQPTVPAASSLALADDPENAHDNLLWDWRAGEVAPASLGDPTTTDGFALCAYDVVAGMPHRFLDKHIPAGPPWKAGHGGFGYKNRDAAASGGIRLIRLRAGDATRAKLRVSGGSYWLHTPTLPPMLDEPLTVQLLNQNACWEAQYSTGTRATSEEFRARSD